MILRLIIFLSVIVAAELYAFQAIRAWVSPWRTSRRRLVKGIYWTVSALTIGLLLLNIFEITDQWGRYAKQMITVFIFLSFLSKLPVIVMLLIDDLRRLFVLIANKISPVTKRDAGRSRFLAKAGLIAGGVPLATLTYGIVRNAYRYRRYAVDVPISGLPAAFDGFKIVQISDMHSGSWTRSEPLKEAVNLINKEQGDIVCFTGDLVNNEAKEMLPFVDIFKEVRGKYGVFSILGNHDYGDYRQWDSPEAKKANMELLYQTHADLGWDLLRDENRIVEIEGQKLALLGVENWGEAFRFPRKADLAKAWRGTEDCACKVLLSHDPTHWDARVRPGYPDIDLTLSGHTHGFQFGIEIPGFRWSPAQYIYKQWAGLYREGEQFLYVNRGLGFLGYPGRVGILPEVTVLTLRKA